MWQPHFAKRLIQHLYSRTPDHYCNDIARHPNCNAWRVCVCVSVCVCVCVCVRTSVYGPRNCLSLLYVSFIIVVCLFALH